MTEIVGQRSSGELKRARVLLEVREESRPGEVLHTLLGEVVVGYGLRLKKKPERLWIAGYSNDVFAYIPSLRVLQEWGYEEVEAMIYYGQPSPFAPTIEEMLIRKVHELIKQVRSESSTVSGRSSLWLEAFADRVFTKQFLRGAYE